MATTNPFPFVPPMQSGLLQRRPEEVPIPPVSFPQAVRGIPLSISVSGVFSLLPNGSQIQVNARLLADLSDLQHKIGALVGTIPLPTDNCAHFGADNLVARIWGEELTVLGDVATLTLHGDVQDWACIQIPFLSPAKTILGTQPFDASIPLRVAVADPHTIAAQIGQPSITLGGQFASITHWLIGVLGINLNALVKEALDHMISPDLLKQTLPPSLLQLNPVITQAELMSNAGALALYAEMSAGFDGSAVVQLARTLFGGAGG